MKRYIELAVVYTDTEGGERVKLELFVTGDIKAVGHLERDAEQTVIELKTGDVLLVRGSINDVQLLLGQGGK